MIGIIDHKWTLTMEAHKNRHMDSGEVKAADEKEEVCIRHRAHPATWQGDTPTSNTCMLFPTFLFFVVVSLVYVRHNKATPSPPRGEFDTWSPLTSEWNTLAFCSPRRPSWARQRFLLESWHTASSSHDAGGAYVSGCRMWWVTTRLFFFFQKIYRSLHDGFVMQSWLRP